MIAMYLATVKTTDTQCLRSVSQPGHNKYRIVDPDMYPGESNHWNKL